MGDSRHNSAMARSLRRPRCSGPGAALGTTWSISTSSAAMSDDSKIVSPYASIRLNNGSAESAGGTRRSKLPESNHLVLLGQQTCIQPPADQSTRGAPVLL